MEQQKQVFSTTKTKGFQQMHNQGLRQLFLMVSWDEATTRVGGRDKGVAGRNEEEKNFPDKGKFAHLLSRQVSFKLAAAALIFSFKAQLF